VMMWLDAYERRCRLLPGLLAVMPIAIAITALGIKDAPVVSAALGLLSLAGGPVLIASVVRRKGLAAQDALWRNWGGPPTTRFLRSRESSVSTVQREAWRQAIEVATNVSLLSARREKSNQSELTTRSKWRSERCARRPERRLPADRGREPQLTGSSATSTASA